MGGCLKPDANLVQDVVQKSASLGKRQIGTVPHFLDRKLFSEAIMPTM